MELNNTQSFIVRRLFSSGVVGEMKHRGRSPLFAHLLDRAELPELLEPGMSVGSLFDRAFSALKHPTHRCDYVYRNAIVRKLLLGRHSLKTTALLNEFRVWKSKADMVLLNGSSHVYEIKSERDSLVRLQGQISDYRRMFASISVVTGERFLEDTMAVLPKEIGIIRLTDRFQLSTVRPAVETTKYLEPRVVFDRLRRDEAIELCTSLGCDMESIPKLKLRSHLTELTKSLSKEEFHTQMVRTIKQTRSQRDLAEFVCSAPASLSAAILATRPSPIEQRRLRSAFTTSIEEVKDWSH